MTGKKLWGWRVKSWVTGTSPVMTRGLRPVMTRGAAGLITGGSDAGRWRTVRTGLFGLAAVVTLVPGAALAALAGTEVTDAWTTAGGTGGGEAPLYMTVVNHGGKPDALLRVRCPVAWAAEPRATDRGEGGLASRAVKSIAIPPDATVTLEPGGFHVALLQLKAPLHEGDTFNCAVTFSDGPSEVPVRVRAEAETAHDLR